MPAKADGQVLAGRYRVLKRLGSGGMATVFLCEDTRLRRRVAVKRLHAESPRDTAQRFQREARLGASLNHHNLVSVYDAVTDEEAVLIVMEHVDGPNLAKLIQREGGLDTARALEVLRGTAEALDHAHREGVIHRDVKPANILIGSGGEVKLGDLGVAMALEGTRITHSGAMLGTVSYMAPEQLDGAEPGPASDIYSLAIVAFEVLSGHKARVGRTPVQIARRIVSEEPPLLSDAWPAAPAEAVDVVRRGMARDPAERPGSAGTFVNDLERALEPTLDAGGSSRTVATAALPDTAAAHAQATSPARRPVHTRTASPRRRPQRLVPAPLIAALALLLVGGALLLAAGDDDEGGSERGGEVARERGQGEGPAAAGGEQGGAQPPPAGEEAPAQAAGGAGSPEGAVQAFYQRAADGDFEGAWALAGPDVRNLLGGYDAFVSTLDSLESIEFRRLEAARIGDGSATVDLQTVARHTDRTDRCTGTAQAVEQGDGWIIGRLSVSCQ